MNDVIIDVWRVPNTNIAWATTTISGVVFAVLERLDMCTELGNDIGLSGVTVHMHGKHPTKVKEVDEVYECEQTIGESGPSLDIRTTILVDPVPVFILNISENKSVRFSTVDAESLLLCKIAKSAGSAVMDEEVLKKFGTFEVVDDAERDYPGCKEIPVPKHLASSTAMGALLGSVALPFMNDVIIDVWRVPKTNIAWATTTISGVVFAVLERLDMEQIIDEDIGDSCDLVHMLGIHPTKSKELKEIYENEHD